ncbi:hypothetical protein SAMN04488117_101619 [Celeribacter baekdonensis]|uniref:Uncharacterized protein n=1 Tax=Celeribacter baekdonensis TaxID=875171 RepID=A0A1G7GLG2_9RHOB|nr:hypothetical protein SAMN04488117_101619 [Celeribacter baekdonensis]
MAFTYRETQIVKGMLNRGDKQHGVASYFGVNGGRIAEVSTGKCDYPNAQPLQRISCLLRGLMLEQRQFLKSKKSCLRLGN